MPPKKKKKPTQNNKRNYKVEILNATPWLLRILFLAQLGGRIILGLRISLFSLGLGFLCFGLSSILGLQGGLSLLALTLVFGRFSPLALITSLARSFWSLRRGKSSLSSQRLSWSLWSKRRGRRDGNWDFTNIWVIVYAPRLPPLRVCRDSYKVEGFCPCYIKVIPADLD